MNIIKRSLTTAGAGPVEKAVIKATYGGDQDVPKGKHVQALYSLRADDIPAAARLLRERTHSREWVVALKSLNVVHLMLANLYADDFAQACRRQRGGSTFDRDMFFDSHAVEQSQFVKDYSMYVARKVHAFAALGLLVENQKAKEGSMWLATLPVKTLCTVLPEAQGMLDALFQSVPRRTFLKNVPCVRSCLRLLLTDGFRLYSLINSHVLAVTKTYQDMSSAELTGTIEGMRKFQQQYQSFKRWYETMGQLDVANGSVDIGECTVPDAFVALLEKRLGEIGNLQRLDLSEDLKDFKMEVGKGKAAKKKKKKKKRESEAVSDAKAAPSSIPPIDYTDDGSHGRDPWSEGSHLNVENKVQASAADPFDPFGSLTGGAAPIVASTQNHTQANNFDPFSFSSSTSTTNQAPSSSTTNSIMDDLFSSSAPAAQQQQQQQQQSSSGFVDHFNNLSISASQKQQQRKSANQQQQHQFHGMGFQQQQPMQQNRSAQLMQQPQTNNAFDFFDS
jgi:hypothetical protein